MRHVEQCRTAALGGHRETCDSCGHIRISYNSCRDRHCPKCQSLKKAQWLEARKERLLPVPYFHVVFTLPDNLNLLVLYNKAHVFNILFSTVAKTLQTIAKDKKHLGGQIGFTAILHTWGQNLLFHPHLHCVVTGGGLSSDGKAWVPASSTYFLPVKVLGKLFRGKFLHALKTAYQEGKLKFPGSTSHLKKNSSWQELMDNLYCKDWVVYSKPPFGGPEHVFRYLGRYTHRVAIGNHRLIRLHHGRIQFRYKDYAKGKKKGFLILKAIEFIRRFLLHVLPKGFVRIRHFGLIAGRNVKTKLMQARRLLCKGSPDADETPTTQPECDLPWWEHLLKLTGIDIFACPACNNGRLTRTSFPKQTDHPYNPSPIAIIDTS